ncbi:MAG: replication initiator, partial [Terriglobales bacterium]
MPKTVHSIDDAALRILEGMVGLDLTTTDHHVPDSTKALLADKLGATVVQQPGLAASGQEVAAATGLVDRVTGPQFGTWMTTAQRAHGCTTPIRLSGSSTTADTITGEVISHFDTADLPNAVLYKACGNRREAACPACSRVYKYDTYQLIKAGMAGGKGVPDTVTSHPALFVTLTAPSFGPVHTRVQKKPDGPVLACRPHFRDKPACRHGRPLYCAAKHAVDDRRLGTPMCVDCYDHAGHVVWTCFAPQLWTRTAIAWSRALTKVARVHGDKVRIRYAKVAEFQTRGLVHFHALLRLDGYDPEQPEQVLPPPACITADAFRQAVTDAVGSVALATPLHPDTG